MLQVSRFGCPSAAGNVFFKQVFVGSNCLSPRTFRKGLKGRVIRASYGPVCLLRHCNKGGSASKARALFPEPFSKLHMDSLLRRSLRGRALQQDLGTERKPNLEHMQGRPCSAKRILNLLQSFRLRFRGLGLVILWLSNQHQKCRALSKKS